MFQTFSFAPKRQTDRLDPAAGQPAGDASTGGKDFSPTTAGQLAVPDAGTQTGLGISIGISTLFKPGESGNFLHHAFGIGDANGQGKAAWAGRRFAIIGIAFAAMLPYACIQWLAAFYFHNMTGAPLSAYLYYNSKESLISVSTLGAWVAMIGYLGFLRSFADAHTPKTVHVMRTLFFLLCLLGSSLDGTSAVLTCLSASFLCIAVTFLGGLTRRALPDTFRFGRAIGLTGLGHAPSIALCVYLMFYATSKVGKTAAAHKVESWDALALMSFLSFIVILPSYALARCARTSEVKPLITLALLVHSPLFVGLLFQAILVIGAEGGVIKGLAMLMALLTTIVPIAFGAALGAKKNGLNHRRMLAK